MILSGRISLRKADSVRRASEGRYRNPSLARRAQVARERVMLEVEMKFPVSDFADVENALARVGARPECIRRDIDHYFNAPDRDFARTDEALRLRRIDAANFVTYKGPKQDAQTKTRTEIEVPLAEGPAAAEGFVRVLT